MPMTAPNSFEPGVSVVVVSYNTRDVLRRCLEAIEPEHEVIVVDNASKDGSPDMIRAEFPSVKLIEPGRNLGFGAANNLGMQVATREWTLFLNSDAFAFEEAIAELAAELDRLGAIAGGGRLLNEDGSLQQSVAGELTLGAVFREQFLLEKLFRGYWRTPTGSEPVAVDQVMGACLMTRTAVERFDEAYFLYCEDTDLCVRLKGHGQIYYVPTARFTHLLGTSSSVNRWLAVARYNLGKEMFFERQSSRLARIVCWLLNRTGALLRLIGWGLVTIATLGRTRGQVALFARVLFARSADLDPRR